MDMRRFHMRYPEFKGVDDDLLTITKEDCETLISKRKFGNFYEQAVCALIAHKLATKGVLNKDENGEIEYSNGEGFKSVTGMTAGGLSLSYSSGTMPATSSSDGDLGTTSYGLEYLRLLRIIGMPFMVIR